MIMKIGILSRNRKLYSTSRLVEAATERGHEVQVLDTLKCYMDINSAKPMIYYKGEPLEGYDAVIPRIGASITEYGTAVIRQFEMMGVYCLTESIPLGRSRDKLRALQLMSRKGVGMPVTGFAHDVENGRQLIKMVGGTPVVLKLLEGTQGRGVVLAETYKAAESVIDAFIELGADFLVQEFIKEAGGSDVRAFVIGRRVVAAMERSAAEGEFRSNLHRGGSASATKLTPEERRTAVKAAQTMGLSVAGVDILRSSRGPLIMEVNSSPGLRGIEEASGKDIAGRIIAFVEENARPTKSDSRRTRG
jgi:ribosomal protein S6--L-glutamate ligase